VMSSRATAWAQRQPLTGSKKLLLLAIARAVDETGACRSVTQDGLAASCGCTVRQVRRLVGELAAERYLAQRRRGRRGGGRAPDLYALPREARERNDTTPDVAMSALVETASKPDI
jgi:predicted ArsR family transcriptional regulator